MHHAGTVTDPWVVRYVVYIGEEHLRGNFQNRYSTGTFHVFARSEQLNIRICRRRAVSGCEYVIHTAMIFPKEAPRDENEIIRPAVEGTLSVLAACRKHHVKRVVMTSSVAAIIG